MPGKRAGGGRSRGRGMRLRQRARKGGPVVVQGWCPRPESNRYGLAAEGFSYHFDFRRRRVKRRSWSGARLHHSLAALGARRLLSTPSRFFRSGLGSALARNKSRAFAEFDGLHLWSFLRRAQMDSSPLCLPISPLGHWGSDRKPQWDTWVCGASAQRYPAGVTIPLAGGRPVMQGRPCGKLSR